MYSDRARVMRSGSLAVKDGRQRIVVPSLPFALDDASVSAAIGGKSGAGGARILSIEVERAFGKRANKKEAEALLAKFEALQRKSQGVQDELNALSTEEQFLRTFTVKLKTDEKGRPLPLPLDPASWQATLNFVSDSLQAVLARTRAKQAEQRALAKEINALSVEIGKVQSYESEAVKQVALEIEGSRSENIDVEVTYSIAGPAWRPAYDVRVLSSTGKVEIVTHGVVRQSTGEDWKDAELIFSTAFPEAGADIPELLAWRLGDSTQYAHAAAQGGVGGMSPGIAVASVPSPKPAAQPSRSSARGNRRDAAKEVAEAPAEEYDAPEAEYAPSFDFDSSSDYASDDEAAYGEAVAMEPPPPAPAAAPMQAHPTSPMAHGALSASRDANAEGKRLQLEADRRAQASIRSTGPKTWSLPAGHRFAFQNQAAESFTWSGDLLYCPSPRVSAGGFDFAFKPERKQTVLSDGRERKIRLSTGTFPAALLYEVVAPLSTKAYLRAELKNDRKQPFLAGESFVFLDDDFVGRAFIATVAPGEKLDLSLGIDEDVKVERRLEQTAETRGVVSKKDRTVYTTLLTVRSFKKRPIDVLLRDQIPVTWQKDDITVDTLKIAPEPIAEKDMEPAVTANTGLLAWKLTIAPGAKQDLKIQYAVERPRDFDLIERRN